MKIEIELSKKKKDLTNEDFMAISDAVQSIVDYFGELGAVWRILTL